MNHHIDHHMDSPSGPIRQIRAASAGAGRNVDILSAVAGVLAALAVVAWAITVLVHVQYRDDQNASAVVLAAVLAATITTCGVACAVGAANRRYARTVVDQDIAVLCRRLDRVVGVAGAPPAPVAGGVLPSPAADEWRAYLAGRLDRDDPN